MRGCTCHAMSSTAVIVNYMYVCMSNFKMIALLLAFTRDCNFHKECCCVIKFCEYTLKVCPILGHSTDWLFQQSYRISLISGYYFYYVWLLLEGGIYFVDSNDGWIRYMGVIQLGLIDAGSSTCSLSVLLLAVEMSLRTQTALEIAQWASVAII